MQVETRRIYVHGPDAHALRAIMNPEFVIDYQPMQPAKQLVPGKGSSFDKPTFLPHIRQEDLGEVQYYGNPYNFNTKYVVDCEADDIIGSVITLASGKQVWVDLAAATVHQMCNRR